MDPLECDLSRTNCDESAGNVTQILGAGAPDMNRGWAHHHPSAS